MIGDIRKGKLIPRAKANKWIRVDTGFSGIIATRNADANMGNAHGAAMRVYVRPRIKAPTKPLTVNNRVGSLMKPPIL